MSGNKNGSQGGGSREYIVHKGRQTGTFNSWSEAKEQVSGYPHNCYERVKSDDNSRYIVHSGRNPGEYSSWSKAHEQVSGYPGNSYEKVKGGKY